MAALERDEVPMLSEGNQQSMNQTSNSRSLIFPSRTRSASISIPMDSFASYQSEANLVSYTGPLRSERSTSFMQMSGPLYLNRPLQPNQVIPTDPKSTEHLAETFASFTRKDKNNWEDDNYSVKNEHLLRSGQLGMCNDPYCTTCPTFHNLEASEEKLPKYYGLFDHKFQNALYGDAKGWARRIPSFLYQYIPGIMNPHTKVVQQWNKFFAISCLVAIFVDPLFFFLLSVSKTDKCILIDRPMSTAIVLLRSITDIIQLLNMLLQFRLAYIAPESRVVGAGDLVDHPKKIALNYLRGYFFIDLLVILPLPQIMILFVIPKYLGSSAANYAKPLLCTEVLVPYIPKLFRFLPLIRGQTPNGFIFESAWANFIINLLTFMLAGHVVGSCWYLFGLQRVNQCFRKACHDSSIQESCISFMKNWTGNTNACFSEDSSFKYGIYKQAVNLTTEESIVTRYVYSLFWGFQQISTLAGNQVPSYSVCEVLFTMAIIGMGLMLFALLIGNMHNFLQALDRRRLEMQLRRRDVEQWMRHRRLPEELRRRVMQAERYNWAATRGVNEEMLLENLPEDLQRDIRRHLFNFIKKVRIFALMDEPILDAICERLRQKTYIKGSIILYHGSLVEKMLFIVRGKMESIGEDRTRLPLAEGYVCGEELLAWCLEHSSVIKDGSKLRISGHTLLSARRVKCLTNVEAFVLRLADIEEVTKRFSRFLRNPRVQGAIRYESPYWKSLAAMRIQVAWRYRKKRLSRANTA